ncbi:ABC transporter substrate-binding protein [Methanoplanus limicola]|uniref:ABC-type transporter, periplasmic subunit n=1 Tax=Methanoplanus limicola DSM 2279 TaxID=937775 RepID=H1Z256_9EURY|nr:ABC transporter substrate-binding protein [Methanoplanus limicola]EHQ36401.1 ABC-type transporter, periplasmic subunit [Methanoplanus limicola DSM 2279]
MQVKGTAGWIISISALVFLLIFSAGCVSQTAEKGPLDTVADSGDYRTITDSRGVEVKIPAEITRVVTVSDGLVEGVMYALGVEDTLSGLGSACIQKDWTYSYPTDDGGYVNGSGGCNIMQVLYPEIRELPLVMQSGSAMNYETLSSLEPDVVILRLGSCSLQEKDSETAKKTIETIESLGIPLVVLYSPNCYEDASLSRISDEIGIIGDVFGKKEEAEEIAGYLESQTAFVEERTADIPEDEKPSVLMFGLSPTHRAQGGAGVVQGLGTTESYMIEDSVNAINAYQVEAGAFQIVNAEQVLALDPDVIVLCTAWGYHPPGELTEATYYESLRELSAVKTGRVMSLPWTPCNCAKRLEYPIDLMVIAKAAYPEKFENVALDEWLTGFYKNVYGVDDNTAEKLRAAQWMNWCVEE